jgi:putative ABC transport system ATP-binding protein
MERNLFGYIWRRTRLQQIWILIIILLSMPASFALLDLPKSIVNGPIQGRGFENGATQKFFAISLPVPSSISSNNRLALIDGFDLNRTTALFVLSALFLILVIINGVFKYYINTYKGRLGEQMLQVLRFELFDRILRFPATDLSRVKPAEVATMIKDEVEPLGGFIGDAFVQPFFLGGQILTSLVFILVQSIWLGLVTIILLVAQGVVIPRLRRRLLVLSRQRQISARALAGRIGEVIEDMPSIRSNDIANFQRAEIIHRLTQVFFIRFALYQWKFLVKFLNNLLAQLTPFFYYAIGGYFATLGLLNIGQLVAVISAYKDLPSPVKELIDWDQQRLDVEVKYHQVIDQFSAEGTLLPPASAEQEGPLPRLEGELSLDGVTVTDASEEKLLDNLDLTVGLSEIAAIVNADRGGAEVLADTLAGLIEPESGHITINHRNYQDWPRSVINRRISYSGPEPFFPQSTIADALLAGVRFAPQKAQDDKPPKYQRVIDVEGVNLDFESDWVDYDVAGADGSQQLFARMRTALWIVHLEDDVVNWGLNRTLDQDSVTPDLQNRIVKARSVLRKRLVEAGLTHLVEPFDPDRFCRQATVAENLLFGAARNPADKDRLAESPLLLKVLTRHRLDADLFLIGRDIAATVIEVFSGITADNRLFAQQVLMGPDEFADYDRALKRLGPNATYARANRADRFRLLRLALTYIEPRDRLGLLSPELEARIVAARHSFHVELGAKQDQIAFYDPATYNEAASLQDNILLGRIAFGVASASKRVNDFVRTIVDDLGLRDVAFRAGINFDIGPAGKRLSRAQRQQLSLARALLRRPDLLVGHRALAALDGQSQLLVLDRVLTHARGVKGDHRFGVIWALENPRFAEMFDRVLVLEHGKLVENGRPDEFRGENSYFGRLRT